MKIVAFKFSAWLWVALVAVSFMALWLPEAAATIRARGQNGAGESTSNRASRRKPRAIRPARSADVGNSNQSETRQGTTEKNAAQRVADEAVAGIDKNDQRISELDDYVRLDTIVILFGFSSAELSARGKDQLDQVATKALNARAYVLEISGYADVIGSTEANRLLSQRRADAVIRYLVQNHRIPLRRIITPYGYGESLPVGDSRTKEGREKSRRVEVGILISRKLGASK